MPDHSKCPGTACPVKEQCWRYTSPSSDWQAWNPFEPGPEGCEGFIRDRRTIEWESQEKIKP